MRERQQDKLGFHAKFSEREEDRQNEVALTVVIRGFHSSSGLGLGSIGELLEFDKHGAGHAIEIKFVLRVQRRWARRPREAERNKRDTHLPTPIAASQRVIQNAWPRVSNGLSEV